ASPGLRLLLAIGRAMTHWYEAGMRWSLRHPGPIALASVGVMVLTVFAAMRLPREILPRVDEGIAVAYLKLPEGTSIEATTGQADRIEQAARTLGASGVYSR